MNFELARRFHRHRGLLDFCFLASALAICLASTSHAEEIGGNRWRGSSPDAFMTSAEDSDSRIADDELRQ
jgi:hypothetical protein